MKIWNMNSTWSISLIFMLTLPFLQGQSAHRFYKQHEAQQEKQLSAALMEQNPDIMINIFYRQTQKRSALKFFCCYGDSPVLSCFIIKSHAIFAGCVGLHACSQKWTSRENKQWLVLADSYKNNFNCMFVCLHECLRESCPSKASTRRHLLLIFASLDQRFMFFFFFLITHIRFSLVSRGGPAFSLSLPLFTLFLTLLPDAGSLSLPAQLLSVTCLLFF